MLVIKEDAIDIAKRIEEIKSIADDDEAAHRLEAELFYRVLLTISVHSHDPWACDIAKEALRSRDIKFERWY